MLGALVGVSQYSLGAIRISQIPLREGGLGLFPQAELRSITYAAVYVQSWSTIGLRAAANTEFFDEGNTAGDLTMYNKASLNPSICLDQLLDLECSRMLWEEKFVTSKLQRRATIRWGQSAWTSLFVSLPRNSQYRLTDFGSPIGRAWMYPIPSAPRYTLSDRTFLLPLRHRLDIDMDQFSLFGYDGSNHCRCNPAVAGWTPEHASVSSMPLKGTRFASVVGLMLKFTSLKRITSIDYMISALI
jgi:hypothetical protein